MFNRFGFFLISIFWLLLGAAFGYISMHRESLRFFRPRAMEAGTYFRVSGVDSVQVISGTFLGNEQRRFYGRNVPDTLLVVWKVQIGGGKTIVKYGQPETWAGAGWTGQPLLVAENRKLFVLQGCYDHTLKKLDAETGEIIWAYHFDDILKGTGTIWKNPYAVSPENRFLVLQGSRLGTGNHTRMDTIPSYRAVSLATGREVWRMNVRCGPSYSRDLDGSALLVGDTAYLGMENGFLGVFNPSLAQTEYGYQPLLEEHPLFDEDDSFSHGGELVTESSPAKLGNHIYITTGSGHVYGYNLNTRKIDWNLELGADLNGSPVVTDDSCLLVTLEKQFITTRGGLLKIDPKQEPQESIVWFFPTDDRKFSNWMGGIIGTACVGKLYGRNVAGINALDGNFYLVDSDSLSGEQTLCPGINRPVPVPVCLRKVHQGPSISTPLLLENHILTAGYEGIHLWEVQSDFSFREKGYFRAGFEATPVVYRSCVYITSRNGYMYCLGKPELPDTSGISF